jgi:hypothetical protein
MLINEIINELTFGGSRCTKDCSGHKAGYRWALRKGATSANSKSPSFNNGVNIAGNQMQAGLIKSPKVRDDRGRFYFNPK